MKNERIQELIARFNAHKLTAVEQQELEQLVEAGHVSLDELTALHPLENKIMTLDFPEPGEDLDHRFYQMLALEKNAGRKTSFWSSFFTWPTLAPHLAFASVALVLGLAAGYYLKPSGGSDEQIQQMAHQLSDMKEMMMLTLLEKESATERLRAVNLTQEMNEVSSTVTSALLKTLNEDDNVNVRLAALDALRPYTRSSTVREALIRSIAMQQSPLVQVALAELMAEIQEKSSVKELEKIIQSEQTPADIKNKIKESIKVLS